MPQGLFVNYRTFATAYELNENKKTTFALFYVTMMNMTYKVLNECDVERCRHAEIV